MDKKNERVLHEVLLYHKAKVFDGNPDECILLAYCCLYGERVEQSEEECLKYYKLAAEKGSARG